MNTKKCPICNGHEEFYSGEIDPRGYPMIKQCPECIKTKLQPCPECNIIPQIVITEREDYFISTENSKKCKLCKEFKPITSSDIHKIIIHWNNYAKV